MGIKNFKRNELRPKASYEALLNYNLTNYFSPFSICDHTTVLQELLYELRILSRTGGTQIIRIE